MMVMAGMKISWPKRSFRKLTPRAMAAPEIAPAKWPNKPADSRGSKTTGTACDLALRGPRRAMVRSPARRPIASGDSRSLE